MAIAQLIETLDAGGAEALAVEIANALAVRGLASHLIVVDGGGRFQQRVHPFVCLHDLKSPRSTGRLLARVIYFGRIHRQIATIVAANGIDVVQSHLPKANFFGLTLAALKRVQVHSTVHNNREFDYGDNPGILIEKGRRAAYWSMLRVNAEMIAVSPEVKTAIADELGVAGTSLADKIVAVSNGVACAAQASREQVSATRKFWQIADDEILLVAAGRLTRQKNFSTLIAALQKMPRGLPKWKCIIGGEGELRGDLESQIRRTGLIDQVRLPGHVDRLRDLMDAADVFCLSSRFEGLPLVMLEAMSSGLPVCAFGIPGVCEVITDGREGLLAEPKNIADLSRIMAQLIGEKGTREKLGQAARHLVRHKYSFETMIDRLVSLYGVG